MTRNAAETDSLAENLAGAEPKLLRDQYGAVDYDSLPEVIQWFLDYDQRVGVIKHAKVEELFQWKQEQSRLAREDVFHFNRAEDRLAIGILQSVAHNPTERELHAWIAQLLNALDRASKATEDISAAYDLDMSVASGIACRTGRSLDDVHSNPYYGRVKTASDLVYFFNHQPEPERASQVVPGVGAQR